MWEENVIKYFKRDRQIAPHLRDFVTPLALGGMPVAGTTLLGRLCQATRRLQSCISQFTSFYSTPPTSQMGGGQRFDEFVAKYFTKTEAADPWTNRSAEEPEAEFDRLRVASSDTQGTNQLSKPICCETPPSMQNFTKCTTSKRSPRSGKELLRNRQRKT